MWCGYLIGCGCFCCICFSSIAGGKIPYFYVYLGQIAEFLPYDLKRPESRVLPDHTLQGYETIMGVWNYKILGYDSVILPANASIPIKLRLSLPFLLLS